MKKSVQKCICRRLRTRKQLNEFPDKGWKLGSIDYLLKKICKTGTVNTQPDSGRPRSTRTEEITETVGDCGRVFAHCVLNVDGNHSISTSLREYSSRL